MFLLIIRKKKLIVAVGVSLFLLLLALKLDIVHLKNESLVKKQGDRRILTNILEANLKINEQKYFFIETSGTVRSKSGSLNSRQACSIESAALLNPKVNIYAVFVNVFKLELTEIIKSLETYKNVIFVRLELSEFTKDTPVDWFFKARKIEKTKNKVEHYSDLVRLMLLWR